MTDFFTIRLVGDYSEQWTPESVNLKFPTGDNLILSHQEYSKILPNLKMNIPFSNIKEIIQRKANCTRVILENGSVTVNSKYGLRLFKFLNNDDF